jgi:hypothetical protein
LREDVEVDAAVIVAGHLAVVVEVAVEPPAGGINVIPSYSLTGAAKFDIGDNQLITDVAPGTATGGVYTGVQGDVQRASNGGRASRAW